MSNRYSKLEKQLEKLEFGGTRVVSAKVHQDTDSDGELTLFLELTLTDPPAGEETWPIDDIWALRRMVGDVVTQTGYVVTPWILRFHPQTPGELEPGDLEEQLDL